MLYNSTLAGPLFAHTTKIKSTHLCLTGVNFESSLNPTSFLKTMNMQFRKIQILFFRLQTIGKCFNLIVLKETAN